jgi:CRISPR/Cas system endoribonuclease Cas6 (RAMP superfamily)
LKHQGEETVTYQLQFCYQNYEFHKFLELNMKKKYKLTKEHEVQLPAWRDKWIANAMSTQTMTDEDKQICTEAVYKMYKFAGLEKPAKPVNELIF